MKRINYIIQFKISIIMVVLLLSCNKIYDWLDEKGNLNNISPSTLADYQAILDNTSRMNYSYPSGGAVGSDNYYLLDNQFNAVAQWQRNCYIFATDIYAGSTSADWNEAYRIIELANIVLDGLVGLQYSSSERLLFNNSRGSALFYRAMAYYMLSQIYCASFEEATADTNLGLVLRTSSDINLPSVRSSVRQTYNLMIDDLREAIQLLPVSSSYQTRPTRPAANALLAKVYLSMENYTEAYNLSDSSLNEFSTLLDYNSDIVNLNSNYRFPPMPQNPEILFYAYQLGVTVLSAGGGGNTGNVDTLLYESYHDNDLRKTLYYRDNGSGLIKFLGTYASTFYRFCGIATNEVLLIRAESAARLNNPESAMDDLNTLLRYRYISGTYNPFDTGISAEEALFTVLAERRKELAFTGQLRWEDLRRLNKDVRFSKTIMRNINSETYNLPPNDRRYVYPIPDDEIALSGIQQNER